MRKQSILSIASLVISLACASQAAVVLDVDFSELSAGTIADGQGVLDSSGNGYHLALAGVGANSFSVLTNAGNVHVENSSNLGTARFALNPAASNPDWAGATPDPSIIFDTAKSYTFEAVVKPHYHTGVQGLVGTTDPGSEFWFRINGGVLQYTFDDGTDAVTDTSSNSDVSSYLNDGDFHNFTLVLDKSAGEARTYVDGILLSTLTNATLSTLGNVLDGSEEFRVAGYNTFNGLYGISDRYRISDTALATNAFLTAPSAPLPADVDPPTPNAATFATAPMATGSSNITMTATTGLDPSGPVEYLFTETSGNPGGTDSGWVTDPVYIDSGLDPETLYTYTVTMRDSVPNTGTPSAGESATTDADIPFVPGIEVDIDFSETILGSVGDGYGFLDHSGNDYHAWLGGLSGGSHTIVSTVNGGKGLSNSASSAGYLFGRDGQARAEWGNVPTPSPYFKLDGNNAFTLEVVVNWDTLGTTRNGLMNGVGTSGLFWWRENGGSLQYVFGVENTKDAREFGTAIDVSAAKADGEFHHIALVYDGAASEIRSYLDGDLLHTNPDADIGDLGNLYDGLQDFRFGRDTSANFEGTLDQFRISNYALDPSEFIGGTAPPPSAAVLFIENGAGSVVVSATNLEATATYTLQSKDDLISGTWDDILPAVTGVTETNWVVVTTNAAFFQVESN